MPPPSRILPPTPWTAAHLWSTETKPLAMLTFSLILLGIGDGMLVQAGIGSTPWTVFAQGIAATFGISLGWAVLAVSAAVMLLWLPLKLRPGLGTLLNMLLIALAVGVFVRFVPPPAADAWVARITLGISGIIAIGIATALYLTCHMGAGPRDGLMIGICQHTGWRVGIVRTGLEAAVCGAGWLMGGTLGIGTLLFAFSVGWVVQGVLQLLAKQAA